MFLCTRMQAVTVVVVTVTGESLHVKLIAYTEYSNHGFLPSPCRAALGLGHQI